MNDLEDFSEIDIMQHFLSLDDMTTYLYTAISVIKYLSNSIQNANTFFRIEYFFKYFLL